MGTRGERAACRWRSALVSAASLPHLWLPLAAHKAIPLSGPRDCQAVFPASKASNLARPARQSLSAQADMQPSIAGPAPPFNSWRRVDSWLFDEGEGVRQFVDEYACRRNPLLIISLYRRRFFNLGFAVPKKTEGEERGREGKEGDMWVYL